MLPSQLENQDQMSDFMRRHALTPAERLEEDKREAMDLKPVFQTFLPLFTKAYLQNAGIALQELSAQWNLVPDPIKRAIPSGVSSFGLSGGFGVGKTFSLVAALGRNAERELSGYMDRLIEKGDVRSIKQAMEGQRLGLIPYPMWINWPGESASKRAQLFRNQHGEVEDWILSLQDPTRLLILDDIGADRATSQDWTGEVLARVIDERLRSGGPMVWTSNLDARGLVERYGPRTFSRLQSLAPVIALPSMPDLRLKGIA